MIERGDRSDQRVAPPAFVREVDNNEACAHSRALIKHPFCLTGSGKMPDDPQREDPCEKTTVEWQGQGIRPDGSWKGGFHSEFSKHRRRGIQRYDPVAQSGQLARDPSCAAT